ncbi:MAG TPA: hypothetical protein VN181_05515, partial [Thermoanaerobaculia bacterium]|nr:hypothetical protein [Thermoanaerobaculia bacterium]
MARGWESKSVESQQDAVLSEQKKESATAEELEKKQRRESLDLSRRRIRHELEATTSDARKTQLQAALKYLE